MKTQYINLIKDEWLWVKWGIWGMEHPNLSLPFVCFIAATKALCEPY